jgi:hypothetical protein
MEHEYRFSAVMNWLSGLTRKISETEELRSVLHALKTGADSAEGITIPRFVLHTFASLAAHPDELNIPNYIEAFLTNTPLVEQRPIFCEKSINTFAELWVNALSHIGISEVPSLFEPACGSANDYRFLQKYGLARFFNYTGMDLCARNIENGLAMFPAVRFEPGNVFEITHADGAFDYCIVHDLFEHLSIEGLGEAVREICRVTRKGICAGFFSMSEMPEHMVRPIDEYHWNTLSLQLVKELFALHGFKSRVLHADTFLRQNLGFSETHNPNAYSLVLWR